MSRRIGSFSIPRKLIERDPVSVRSVMASCVIIRAELMWQHDAVEYTALSPCFDEVPDECVPIDYTILIHKTGPLDEIRVEFVRSAL